MLSMTSATHTWIITIALASVPFASALTICWSVLKASDDIEQAMDELSDEIRKEKKK